MSIYYNKPLDPSTAKNLSALKDLGFTDPENAYDVLFNYYLQGMQVYDANPRVISAEFSPVQKDAAGNEYTDVKFIMAVEPEDVDRELFSSDSGVDQEGPWFVDDFADDKFIAEFKEKINDEFVSEFKPGELDDNKTVKVELKDLGMAEEFDFTMTKHSSGYDEEPEWSDIVYDKDIKVKGTLRITVLNEAQNESITEEIAPKKYHIIAHMNNEDGAFEVEDTIEAEDEYDAEDMFYQKHKDALDYMIRFDELNGENTFSSEQFEIEEIH